LPVATETDRLVPGPAAIGRWEAWLPRASGVLAVVLSVLLAGMLWFVHRAVQRAWLVLAQGEGMSLVAAAHDALRSLPGRPEPEDVDELLADQWDQGLRYIAILDPEGREIVLEAGEPAAPFDPRALAGSPPMDPAVVGDRVRLLTGPPPRRPRPPHLEERRRPPGRDRFGPPPHPPWERGALPGEPGRGGAPPPGPRRMLIEFEPLRAGQIEGLAARTLWVAVIALPAFLGGAFLLLHLVRQREQLLQRLEHERRLAALGEMTAVIAHEIRNPLASLKGHAQLLARSLDGDARRAKAELVVREAVRLQDLSSDLLDYARSGTLDPRPVDPKAILRECAEAVDPERIVIHVSGAPDRWRLDPARMRQALGNLLRNAVQASPEGAPVDASVYADGGRLVFEVRDRGSGIAPGDEQRIFEPFYTSKVRGTGLGLSLVDRIVKQHGGTVDAGTAAEGGAVFRISLAPL
jgi:two-component system sensor histidine kinase HydH